MMRHPSPGMHARGGRLLLRTTKLAAEAAALLIAGQQSSRKETEMIRVTLSLGGLKRLEASLTPAVQQGSRLILISAATKRDDRPGRGPNPFSLANKLPRREFRNRGR